MKVPLENYLRGTGAKVYSLVANVPFSPVDLDLGHLARGEWVPLTDRFRVWYLPRDGVEEPQCYVMVRKFDPNDGVLICAHVVVNLKAFADALGQWCFTIGIMSNDEVRARSMLNSMLDIPPSFHRRSELRLVERRWRSDSDAVARFLANIHSVMAQAAPDPGGRVYTLKLEPPPGAMGELKRNMGAWW